MTFRARLRISLAIAVSTATLSTITPAVAQPGVIIAQAESATEGLVGSLTDSQSDLDRLELEVGALRESVNQSLVDLHDAQATTEQARQGVITARAELDQTQSEIEEAQANLDEISRSAYRRTTALTAVTTLAGEEAAEASLDRQTYLRSQAERQSEAIEALDLLRTEQANKESQLRQARDLAEAREKEATTREADARAAIEATSQQIISVTAERDRLAAERDAAQAQLDEIRNSPAETPAQQTAVAELESAEQNQQQAEDESAATAQARAAAEEEAARVAADKEAAIAASETAAQRQAESEAAVEDLGDNESAETRQEAEAAASEAAEAAQQAEQEAQELAEAEEKAAEEAAELARQDEQNQALQDLAVAAASAAAAALIAQSQADHTSLDNPYPSVSDEESDPVEIAAIQNPEALDDPAVEEEPEAIEDDVEEDLGEEDVEESSPVQGPSTEDSSEIIDTDLTALPPINTIEDITAEASETVLGDRSATIEAVIARAQTQIGVPYAWGGGNATGPTLGIRDGGVADSYGDYQKIGFDCSGLMIYAFAGAGIALPHYTGYQYNHGTKIDPSQMERGDLIFYGSGGSNHVAIFLGDGMMLEAPSSGSYVKTSPVRWSGMSEYAVRLI
ncbi:DIP1281 family NlpC/P60 protein [Corynebacterium alimapuense]|uniref:Hydrolase n=1 Tax=Corynebacterium alimapuense TaxID=1576874 RepID=A0A3M8K995_9CORY|nr:NlpC/P60 family protein [Corynebacterium alimapuense]RNE49730.1 hydrolase [Corynebacterium alimapuense]